MNIHRLRHVAVACALAAAGSTQAAVWVYTGPDGGTWSTAGNWTLAGGSLQQLPAIGDDVRLGSALPAASLSFDAIYTGAGLNSLTLNATAQPGGFTLNQAATGSALIAATEFIGTTTTGNAYVHSAGSNTTQQLYLGQGNGSFGSYALSGTGQLTLGSATGTGATLVVGSAGTGAFNQSGGTTQFLGNNSSLTVGASATSTGSALNLSGGSLRGVTQLTVANATSASLNISGGSLSATGYYNSTTPNLSTVGTVTLGSAGGTGTVNLTGGNLSVNGYVDGDGNAHFGSLTVGGAGSTALVNIGVAGQGSAPTLYVGGHEYVAQAGATARIVQAAGSHNVDGDLLLGAGTGANASYTMSGGSLSVGGNLVIANGSGSTASLSVSGSVSAGTVQVGNLGAGALTITGGSFNTGTLTVGATPLGSGSVTQTGGVVSANTLSVGQAGSQARYVLAGPSSIFAGNAAVMSTVQIGANGSFEMYGGSLGIYSNGQQNQFGANNYAVNNSGTFLSHGTAVSLTNGFTNQASGVATFEGGSSFLAYLGSGLTNFGTLNINGTDLFSRAGPQAQIANYGTVNLSGTGSSASLGGKSFLNNGVINANGGRIGCTPQPVTCPFTNNGVINVTAGSLSIQTGSSGQASGSQSLNYGTISGSPGAVITLPSFLQNLGTLAVNGASVNGFWQNAAGGVVTGGGTIALGANQTDVTGNTVAFNSGTIAPGAATLRFTDGFTNAGLVQLSGPLSGIAGGTLANLGTVQGTGTVSAPLSNSGTVQATGGGTLLLSGTVTNTAAGTLAVTGGNTLQLQSAGFTNAGLVTASGGGTFAATSLGNTGGGQVQVLGSTLRVSGATTNGAGASINLNGGSAFFTGGLSNSGQLNVSYNGAEIYGALSNASGGKIILSGNSQSSFYGAVDVTAGSELRVSGGSTAVFFGPVYQRNNAVFSGTGTKVYEGGFSVGNSPGLGLDAGNVSFDAGNTYLAEIGGLAAGTQFDAYRVGGSLTFGGTLKIVSYGGFVAQAGQSFDLFDWGSTSGRFSLIDLSGLQLAPGTQLDTSQLYVDGSVSVQAVPEPGTWGLMAAGLLGVGAAVRRRRWQAPR